MSYVFVLNVFPCITVLHSIDVRLSHLNKNYLITYFLCEIVLVLCFCIYILISNDYTNKQKKSKVAIVICCCHYFANWSLSFDHKVMINLSCLVYFTK